MIRSWIGQAVLVLAITVGSGPFVETSYVIEERLPTGSIVEGGWSRHSAYRREQDAREALRLLGEDVRLTMVVRMTFVLGGA